MGSSVSKETVELKVCDAYGAVLFLGAIVQRDATDKDREKYITQKDNRFREVITFAYVGQKLFFTIVGEKQGKEGISGKLTMFYETWKEGSSYRLINKPHPDKSRKLVQAAAECHANWLQNKGILFGDKKYDAVSFNTQHIFESMSK